jgi:hypothetical protein
MDREILSFDAEVEDRCQKIRENGERVAATMQCWLDITLLGIPEHVRHMSVKDVMEKYDGDIQKAAACFAPPVPKAARPGPPPTPPRKPSTPKSKHTKQTPGNENMTTRALESPRGLGAQTRIPMRQQIPKSPRRT